MKGQPMNESTKKRDRLSPGYIKKLLGPMPEEMRAKHREFLQVSGRRFDDPKNRMLRKLSHQVSEFYRLRKLYTKLKKGLGQPRSARSLESLVYARPNSPLLTFC